MSDLKYKTAEELQVEKVSCERYIEKMEVQVSGIVSRINGQKTRLEWINKYLFEKTPQELTIDQIERRLGHKVIIK